MGVPVTVEQILRYAARRGQAVILSEPRTVAARLTVLDGPTKTIRCSDGRQTYVAILYTPPVAVRAS